MPENQFLMVWQFRVTFQAIGPVRFPEGKAANTLRGAIGTTLLGSVKSSHLKQRWFSSQQPNAGPGLSDPPKSFLLRAAHLDGRSFDAGQSFYFDLILFEQPGPILPDFLATFRAWEQAGIGPTHGRVSLSSVINQFTRTPDDTAGLKLLLTASESDLPVTKVILHFQTPTEIKSRGEIVAVPEFPILIRRLTERIHHLQVLYQSAPPFAAPSQDAHAIHVIRSALQQVSVERRSSRTGQRHGMGGFIGEVEYAGDLGSFVPLLTAGEWTGVGRQTVWGKGQYVLLYNRGGI